MNGVNDSFPLSFLNCITFSNGISMPIILLSCLTLLSKKFYSGMISQWVKITKTFSACRFSSMFLIQRAVIISSEDFLKSVDFITIIAISIFYDGFNLSLISFVISSVFVSTSPIPGISKILTYGLNGSPRAFPSKN
jgi:hypothetical protein